MSELSYPWWKEYRRNKYRPRKRISNEMICRKAMTENVHDYLRNCSLAGISYVTDGKVNTREKVFWFLVFCMVVGTFGFCLSYIWSNLNQPLIVSMESSRTYDISNIDFPAVAICNVNRVSKIMSKNLAVSLHSKVKDTHKKSPTYDYEINYLQWLISQAGRLIDFEHDDEFEKNISHFVFDNDIDSSKFIELMEIASPDCNDMLLRCAWSGKKVPCHELFIVKLTNRGHCCVFNSVMSHNGSREPQKVKRQIVSGIQHGLHVVLDPLKDDYAYPLQPIYGFEIFLFEPTHFPDYNGGRVIHRLLNMNTGKCIELLSRTQRASDEVRKYGVKTRKCLFHNEHVQSDDQVYSQSTCIVKCRVHSVQALCKCTPFFLPASSTRRICSIGDLRCLNKHREKFMFLFPINPETWNGLEQEYSDSIFCPECYADCEHTQHYTRESIFKIDTPHELTDKILVKKFLKYINLTNKAYLGIYQSTQDGTLDKLDVVYYWYELLSYVGGFGGILVGFSLISGIEVIYYFLIRFFIKLRELYSENNK